MRVDQLSKGWRVCEDGEVTQDLRNAIVSKHRQLILIDKAHLLSSSRFLMVIESTNEVCTEDLGSLIEKDLAATIDSLIPESLESVNDCLDESGAADL